MSRREHRITAGDKIKHRFEAVLVCCSLTNKTFWERNDVISRWQNRQLLRDRFMVELVEGSRKLRHVFLFTDLLLCTKLKKQAAG